MAVPCQPLTTQVLSTANLVCRPGVFGEYVLTPSGLIQGLSLAYPGLSKDIAPSPHVRFWRARLRSQATNASHCRLAYEQRPTTY